MRIRTSEPCSALTHMKAKLFFTIAILLRQYMMELLSFALIYSHSGQFTQEDLYEKRLRKKMFLVSPATLSAGTDAAVTHQKPFIISLCSCTQDSFCWIGRSPTYYNSSTYIPCIWVVAVIWGEKQVYIIRLDQYCQL